MPRYNYYYGIDLGTTNTVISALKAQSREGLLVANERYTQEIVPIYYEKYRWDPSEGRYLDYDEAILHDMEKENLAPGKMTSGLVSVKWRETLPSVVYLHKTPGNPAPVFLTGQAALDMYNEERCAYPERFFENTKSLMDQDVQYEKGSLTAVDIAKHLLRTCFMSIRKHIEANDSIGLRGIGISYPAARNQMNYLKSLKEAAVEAAREVGLIGEEAATDFFCTTQEPYAAMAAMIMEECRTRNDGGVGLGLIQRSESKCVNLMVVDVGGGTTDIAIQPIQSFPWERAYHMPLYPENCLRESTEAGEELHWTDSAVNVNGDFGGADFDELLARKITRILAENAGVNLDVNKMSPYVRSKALRMARAMKHGFANAPDRRVWRENSIAFFGPLDTVHDSTLVVERDQYDEWIRPYVRSTAGFADPFRDYKRMTADDSIYSIERLIDDTMRRADCRGWNDIDFVFLTGGMSKMSQIKDLLQEKTRGTGCTLIVSDDRFVPVNDTDSPRFKDIAYGVAVYACLNGSDGGSAEVRSRGGRHYRDFVASPHSSVALLADIGEGLPVVLINHSQALPVADEERRDVFKSKDTMGISVQMYTGLSQYDKQLKKLTRNFISLKENPPFQGTNISLIYSIGQDMHATLKVRYTDAQNKERLVNMNEVYLDAVNRGDD